MNELLSLFPILFFVYALQCIASAPSMSEVFFLSPRLHGRKLRHSWQVGGSQNRLFLLNPFLPFVGAILVDPLPFVARRDANGELLGLESLSSSAQDCGTRVCSFELPHKFSFEETKVFVDGELFLCVRSEDAAKRFAALLDKLQCTPAKGRASLLDKHFRSMFSAEAIDRRLEEYSRSTELLHIASFSLFLFIFLLAPPLIFFRGLHRLWPSLLLYLVLSSAVVLWLFRRSRRELYPLKRGGNLPHMIGVALSPFAAIRANDTLLADLVAEFHPVVVAHRILPKKEFLEFAGSELRKTKYISSDSTLLQFLTEFLRQQQIDLLSLLAPPTPESKHCRSFCPVCLTQYVIDRGVCQDCGQIALEAFSKNSQEANEPSTTPLD
jgi:hypothetical protein